MAREKSDAIKFANGSLLSELLPVIDSFQMGLSAAINEDPDSIISKGMEMVQKQLEEFFSSQGAVAISSVGKESLILIFMRPFHKNQAMKFQMVISLLKLGKVTLLMIVC